MDAGIADTLNRLDAAKLVEQLDSWDAQLGYTTIAPWPWSSIADTLMGDNDATNAHRAWFIGYLAALTPGVHFDGEPADADWDNLIGHVRAEIVARRQGPAGTFRTRE